MKKSDWSNWELPVYDDDLSQQVWEMADEQRKLLSSGIEQVVMLSTPHRGRSEFYHMYLRAVQSAKDFEEK